MISKRYQTWNAHPGRRNERFQMVRSGKNDTKTFPESRARLYSRYSPAGGAGGRQPPAEKKNKKESFHTKSWARRYSHYSLAGGAGGRQPPAEKKNKKTISGHVGEQRLPLNQEHPLGPP